jgi:hypothetical protein
MVAQPKYGCANVILNMVASIVPLSKVGLRIWLRNLNMVAPTWDLYSDIRHWTTLYFFIISDFTQEPPYFYYTNQKPFSNCILVDIWVQKLTPNQPISRRDPAIASSISFFCVPHENLQ